MMCLISATSRKTANMLWRVLLLTVVMILTTAARAHGNTIDDENARVEEQRGTQSSGAYGNYAHSPTGAISGELRKWHKISIGFEGPYTSETAAPNPFWNYLLYVKFVHVATSSVHMVPGYYGADGNAANTGASDGNVWLAHYAPHNTGLYNWTATFLTGNKVSVLTPNELNQPDTSALYTSGGYFDGMTGSFFVKPTNKVGRDLRRQGMLQYVKQRYLRFNETGEYFLKAGVDSPENLLAFVDFDNTPKVGNTLKTWAPHLRDYNSNVDPYWLKGTTKKGMGIIGAINYLSNIGMKSFSFLTMNINGDDKNVYPYISNKIYDRFDASKTGQWEIVFEHGDKMGMYLHFKTLETENDDLLDDGQKFGINRKLYYRELVARFGHHLALNWNIGEENTNTNEQQRLFIDYLRGIDPYQHHVVIHTFPGGDKVFEPLLGYAGLTGPSMQLDPFKVAEKTEKWVKLSAEKGHPWVVTIDEQTSADAGVVPDADDFNHNIIRKEVLWGNLMKGGAGVEYYFGYKYPNSDTSCEDFRSRENMFKMSKHALDFFNNNAIPFSTMIPSATSVLSSPRSSTSWLATSDRNYIVVYMRDGGTENVDLTLFPLTNKYNIYWFNPLHGGRLQKGTVTKILGGSVQSLGLAPTDRDSSDWVVLIRFRCRRRWQWLFLIQWLFQLPQTC